MTNLECLTQIMTVARYGALAQAFVMDTQERPAKRFAPTTGGDDSIVGPPFTLPF